MRQITWNELSIHSLELLEWIKNGHPLQIYQEGRPIAELLPYKSPQQPAWKRPIQRLNLSVANLSQEILHER